MQTIMDRRVCRMRPEPDVPVPSLANIVMDLAVWPPGIAYQKTSSQFSCHFLYNLVKLLQSGRRYQLSASVALRLFHTVLYKLTFVMSISSACVTPVASAACRLTLKGLISGSGNQHTPKTGTAG